MTVEVVQLAERLSKSIGMPRSAVIELADMLAQCKMDVEDEMRIRAILSKGSLNRRWNHVLDHDRATYLARHLRDLMPETTPQVLDVLAGTGTVASELRRLGCSVFEMERLASYPERKKIAFLFDFNGELYRGPNVDVALVSVTMHHETYLDQLVGWLSQLHVNRYLIVENLRSGSTPAELHAKFDWFFNRCLNSFGEDCPGWYWTGQQWLVSLSSLGRVRWLEQMDDVPGIPFAYDVFEVLPKGLGEASSNC